MTYSLRQIRAFVAIAATGHFARAAESLDVTQSALSMLLKQLEAAMAVRLFDRTTRKVQLTAAGAEFLPVAQRTLADLDAAVTASRELSAFRRGRAVVATNVVLAATIMPDILHGFAALHPGIQVAVTDLPEQDIRARVRARSVDFGIGTVLQSDAELVASPLFSDRLTLVCAHDHPLAKRRAVRWNELQAYPYIALAPTNPIRALADLALLRADVVLTPAFEVSYSSTAISFAAARLGVAALPVNARQVAAEVRVAIRPLIEPEVPRTVARLQIREITLAPAAAAFAAYLDQYFTSHGAAGRPAHPERGNSRPR